MWGYGSWGFGNCQKLEVLNDCGGACCQCCGGMELGCCVLPFSRLCKVLENIYFCLLPPVCIKPVKHGHQDGGKVMTFIEFVFGWQQLLLNISAVLPVLIATLSRRIPLSSGLLLLGNVCAASSLRCLRITWLGLFKVSFIQVAFRTTGYEENNRNKYNYSRLRAIGNIHSTGILTFLFLTFITG